MTVGIACLFSWVPPGSNKTELAALALSDRMVTTGSLQKELAQTKTCALDNGVYILICADDYSVQSRAVLSVQRQIRADTSLGVHEVARIYHEALAHQRSQMAESEILRPRGLTLADIYKQGKEIDSDVAKYLGDKVEQFPRLSESGLVIGRDDGQAHIYHVDCANYFLEDDRGYAVIGSGGPEASLEFARSAYSKGKPYQTALFTAFVAKRAAENSIGVGPKTDVYRISSLGVEKFGADVEDIVSRAVFIYQAAVSRATQCALTEIRLLMEKSPYHQGSEDGTSSLLSCN